MWGNGGITVRHAPKKLLLGGQVAGEWGNAQETWGEWGKVGKYVGKWGEMGRCEGT